MRRVRTQVQIIPSAWARPLAAHTQLKNFYSVMSLASQALLCSPCTASDWKMGVGPGYEAHVHVHVDIS